MGYQDTYAAMSDEVLMNVASDIASLEDAARVAITAELNRRHISDTDIGHYRQEVAAFNPKEFWGTQEYVARSFNGCGTMILGKRDFWPDAYLVHERGRPCWRQVAYTWAYLPLLLLAIATLNAGEVGLVLLGVASVLPWILRKLARARVQHSPAAEGGS